MHRLLTNAIRRRKFLSNCCYEVVVTSSVFLKISVKGKRDDDDGGGVPRLSEWLLGGCFKTASLPTIVSRGWSHSSCSCWKILRRFNSSHTSRKIPSIVWSKVKVEWYRIRYIWTDTAIQSFRTINNIGFIPEVKTFTRCISRLPGGPPLKCLQCTKMSSPQPSASAHICSVMRAAVQIYKSAPTCPTAPKTFISFPKQPIKC